MTFLRFWSRIADVCEKSIDSLASLSISNPKSSPPHVNRTTRACKNGASICVWKALFPDFGLVDKYCRQISQGGYASTCASSR